MGAGEGLYSGNNEIEMNGTSGREDHQERGLRASVSPVCEDTNVHVDMKDNGER